MHFFQIPDRLLKLGCRVMRDRSVQDLARDVSDAVAMWISMGCDHPMTNGISYAANPFQILGYRAAFQAILQPAPPEQKMSDEGHGLLNLAPPTKRPPHVSQDGRCLVLVPPPTFGIGAFQTVAQIATRDLLQPITRKAPVTVTLK